MKEHGHPHHLDLVGIEEAVGPCVVIDLADGYRIQWLDTDYCDIQRDGDDVVVIALISHTGSPRATHVCSTFPAFFRERGIKRLRVFIGEDQAEMYSNLGFVRDGSGWVSDISQPGCRMDEYRDWKRGEGPKPAWRTK